MRGRVFVAARAWPSIRSIRAISARAIESNVTIVGGSFLGNVAGTRGGAIWANGDTQLLGLYGSRVEGNLAADGGGIWLSADFGDLSDATIGTTSFCGNSVDHVVGVWIDEGGNVFSRECP